MLKTWRYNELTGDGSTINTIVNYYSSVVIVNIKVSAGSSAQPIDRVDFYIVKPDGTTWFEFTFGDLLPPNDTGNSMELFKLPYGWRLRAMATGPGFSVLVTGDTQ